MLPPPGPDPALTAAKDALAADDGIGRAAHLVVQGDHLTYRQLGEVLALVQDADRCARALSVLPPRLRRRLAETGCLGEEGEGEWSEVEWGEVERGGWATYDGGDRYPDR